MTKKYKSYKQLIEEGQGLLSDAIAERAAEKGEQVTTYQRFKALPEGVTRARWAEGKSLNCLNKEDPLKWGGELEVPAIGIEITDFRLGDGVVRGYFVEHGWFGLLVELADPPGWWLKQNKHRKGEDRWAHVFGVDFKLAGRVNGSASST